ncbi:hypothetical protein CIB48_g4574 [Xylaria polymorpha]|nr:hypothetical protein CIB48_g4574 [Xylaria polymorpha]
MAQEDAPTGPDLDAFPDGGLRVTGIGLFQDYYQAHQLVAYSPSTVAWIPATEAFVLFFLGIVSGKLADDYAIVAAATWFNKHRALAFGVIITGSSVGGVVLPILVTYLLEEFGFGWAMRIIGFFVLGLLIFGNLAIESRLPPIKKPWLLKEYMIPFMEAPFLLLAIGTFFFFLGSFLPFTFIIVEAKEVGVPTSLTDYLIPIICAASIFGRIFPAHLGDVYGVFNICIISTIFSGVISLTLWLSAASTAPIVAFAALYGFASGLTLVLMPALVASISDIRNLGFRVGTLYAFSSFGGLFGSPIAGAIVSAQHGSYFGLKIFCGLTFMIGGVFILMSRIKLTKCVEQSSKAICQILRERKCYSKQANYPKNTRAIAIVS